MAYSPESSQSKVLDIIGCHQEVTICGHIDVIRRLPIRHHNHLQLLEQYVKEPGNYEGRHSNYYNSHAKLLDYGNGYVAARFYEDVTRPELGEFLLSKGWKMIGFSAVKDNHKTILTEKWCNIRDWAEIREVVQHERLSRNQHRCDVYKWCRYFWGRWKWE